MSINRLLRRQLTRAGLNPDALPAGMQTLVKLVGEVYDSFDDDRLMLERSMEISAAELLAANRDIRASAEVLERTLQATADGILAVDRHGKVLHVNERYFEILGLPPSIFEIEDGMQRLAMIAERLVDPEDFLQRMKQIMAGAVVETRDLMELKSGKIVERTSRPLTVGDVGSGRVWSYRDITERHLLEEQLRHQAFHDSLTGLANRARFMDRVELAMERSLRTGALVHVLFMDVDNFKAVNDTLGHSKGDATIRELATRISASLRPGDTAARLGGDEFGLLIEDIDSNEEVAALAQRILEVVRAPIKIDGSEVLVDASIGIAASSRHSNAEAMVRNADIAMYVAKNLGKGASSSTKAACTPA
jgi:diguanylate cyclase (GGDEF)-like protein/PAS domain S-box-containing protein